jgi:hypothetical protein
VIFIFVFNSALLIGEIVVKKHDDWLKALHRKFLQPLIIYYCSHRKMFVRNFSSAISKSSFKSNNKKQSTFIKVGLPLLLFVVGGYVGLTQVRNNLD